MLAYVAVKAIMVVLYERARRHADTRLARRFCGWCVVAYGASGEHEGFPGTLSIDHRRDNLATPEIELSQAELVALSSR